MWSASHGLRKSSCTRTPKQQRPSIRPRRPDESTCSCISRPCLQIEMQIHTWVIRREVADSRESAPGGRTRSVTVHFSASKAISLPACRYWHVTSSGHEYRSYKQRGLYLPWGEGNTGVDCEPEDCEAVSDGDVTSSAKLSTQTSRALGCPLAKGMLLGWQDTPSKPPSRGIGSMMVFRRCRQGGR